METIYLLRFNKDKSWVKEHKTRKKICTFNGDTIQGVQVLLRKYTKDKTYIWDSKIDRSNPDYDKFLKGCKEVTPEEICFKFKLYEPENLENW